MHRYIIDNFSQDQKNIKTLDKIELRLADLRIDGERHKTSISKDVSTLTKDVLKSSPDTIVIIGEDQSFYQAVSTILKTDKTPAIGFIPIKKGYYSERFGIPVKADACEVISKRNTVRIRACKVNHFLFLFKGVFFQGVEKGGLFKVGRKKKNNPVYARIQYDEDFKVHGDFENLQLYNSDIMKYVNAGPPREHTLFLKGCAEKSGAGRTHISARTIQVSFEDKQKVLLDDLLEVNAKEYLFDSLDVYANVIIGSV